MQLERKGGWDGERGRRISFFPLVYFPNGCNCPSGHMTGTGARPRPRVRSLEPYLGFPNG